MIVPLPKSQTRHPARAQAPLHLPHMLFLKQNFTNPSHCSHFFCVYEVVQSPHENSWEKGEDFVKSFYVKKLVREMDGSLSARALDDV